MSNKRQKLNNDSEKIININTHEFKYKYKNDMYVSSDDDNSDNLIPLETIILNENSCLYGTYLYSIIEKDVYYDVIELKNNGCKYCVVDITDTNFTEHQIYDIDTINDKNNFINRNKICIIIMDKIISYEQIENIKKYHRYFNC